MADVFQRQQSSLKGQFTSMENDLRKQAGAKISMVKFGAIEKKLEGCRMKMESIHHEIYPLLTDPADQAIQDGEHELLYNRYLQILEDLEVLKPVVPIATPTPNTSAVANSLKLPKFEIPKFNGDITTWNSFYDLFVASVHNHTGYSNAQKLSFLKSSLGPEAVRLISNLQVTDSNYAEALKLLQDRYDNKREIVNSHLKRLFSAPALKDEHAPNLRKLIDTARESIQGLRVLKEPVGTWDSILVFLISEKLDPETRRQWVLSLTCKTVPRFEDFITFLDRRERALTESGSVKPKSFTPVEKKASAHVGAVNPAPPKCYVCPDSHMTFRCPMLLSKPSSERRSIAQNKGLCFNCLKQSHRTASCPSTHTCKICNAKHHTLLHADEAEKEVTTEESHSTAVVSTATSLSTCTTYEQHTILPTAIVNIMDSRGYPQPVRALIDSGSEVSFVSTACVKRLGLPTKPAKLTITGVAAINAGSSHASASFVITSRVYDFSTAIEAYVLHRVANRLPSQPVATGNPHHLQGLQLADPFYYKPEEVDILLGSDVYASLLRPTPVIIGPSGTPSAFDTALGWVVSGPSHKYNKLTRRSFASLHVHCEMAPIQRTLWEIESVPHSAPSTPEGQQCEQHFIDPNSRLASGRYDVSIPFKLPTTIIGLSRDIAIPRLLEVERRFATKPHLEVQYGGCMREYFELGHMERVRDWDMQRIVWRHSLSEANEDWRLTNVTCGTVSAPHLTTRALSQCAKDDFPLTSKVTLRDHSLWWNGPTRLLTDAYSFNSEPSAVVENPDLEAKKTATVLLSTPAADSDLLIWTSSLPKLQRVTANLLRFARNCRGERLLGHLSDEKTKKPFPKSSKVVCLSPFICQGLLRVRGRLRNSKLSSDMKFPILLPKESPLTHLIIGGRSNQTAKYHLAVFVRFVTLAYHPEVVSDRSTSAFIACLHRFVSRRGFCSDNYSDNGRNFVGAGKDLKRFWIQLQSLDSENEMVHRFLSIHNVTWHFNPQAAPHHGDLWESGVRVVKGHLKRVIGTTSLNFEKIATLLAQVEACLNSRPLSPLSSNPEDLSVLTPGHFLLGRPVQAMEPDVTETRPGPDCQVRVVTILKDNGFFHRPIVKLYPLPPEFNINNTGTSASPLPPSTSTAEQEDDGSVNALCVSVSKCV